MNNKPFISVIIPIFNAEKYLSKCLNSIIHQTFENIEIICVNDGSTDNSLNILNKYSKKDDRIKVLSIENHGQGFARNLGLSKANGEYISFIDADDWIEKDSFMMLYEKLKLFDLDILFFQMVNYINSTGELVESDLYNYKSLSDNFNINIPFSHKDVDDFLFSIAVCPVSKLYKKSFLEKHDIKFPEGIIFEDNIFFYNAFLNANNMSFIDKKMYYRRRHADSVTQNISEKSFDIVSATNLMLNLFKENNWYDKYKSYLINHSFSMILEWFFKSKLMLREEFFIHIKENFVGFKDFKQDFLMNLNEEYSIVFNLFIENNHYLDFISGYFFKLANYEIIGECCGNYEISVIIPIYNNETYIHRTLMSIMNQTIGFENIEIILIDDNSTDNTLNVIKEYAYKYDNIKVIHLQENTGSAGTPRNIGIKEASADYVMFLDHDDFFEIGALERLYDKILDKNCDVVFGTYSVIQNSQFHDISYSDEKNGYFNDISDNERFVGFPPPSIWTKIFKKEFIIKNHFLFPPILGEDAIFINKVLLNASGIYYLNDDLICYHVLDDNSTTNNISLNYLVEGLTSEKYMYDWFNSIGKGYYFKYRCEGTLNFFLSQFLRSNLDKDDICEVLPLYVWFLEISKSFGLIPSNLNNRRLSEYFLKKDVNAIYKFKNKINGSKFSFRIKLKKIIKKILNKSRKIKNNLVN